MKSNFKNCRIGIPLSLSYSPDTKFQFKPDFDSDYNVIFTISIVR